MIGSFYFLFSVLHSLLLFAIARDIIIQRREAAVLQGKYVDVARLVAVRERLKKDIAPTAIGALLGGADFLMLFFTYRASIIIGLFLLLFLYLGLAFVTYGLTPFSPEHKRVDVPGSLSNDLRTLAARKGRSILETLRLRNWEATDGRFLKFLTAAAIDPERRVLRLEVRTPDVPESIAIDRGAQKVFFEGVVDLLSVVADHEFFSSYRAYFRRLTLAVSVESTDDIGRLVPVCVFTLEASLDQVRDVLQKGYDLFHLEKSLSVRFDHWKAVQTPTAPGDSTPGSH